MFNLNYAKNYNNNKQILYFNFDQMESKVGSQFTLSPDGILKSQSVALDLDTLVSLWGADLKTNWM